MVNMQRSFAFVPQRYQVFRLERFRAPPHGTLVRCAGDEHARPAGKRFALPNGECSISHADGKLIVAWSDLALAMR